MGIMDLNINANSVQVGECVTDRLQVKKYL